MKLNTLIIISFLLLIFYSCTFTTSRYYTPEVENKEALFKDLGTILSAENANIIGKIVTTNGKSEKLLEIDITNPGNIPEGEDHFKLLCSLIASKVKAHLKDSSDYNSYVVQFINKQGSGFINKTQTKTYTVDSKYVLLPHIEMGKKSSSEDGVIHTSSVFNSKDSGIQCNLRNYTFIDTSALVYIIKKINDSSEETLGKVKIHAIPYSYFSKAINMHEFSNAYGKGKFHLEIYDHNQMIAARNFEVQ